METAAWNIYAERWTNGKRHYEHVARVVGTYEQAMERKAQIRRTTLYGMLRILKEEPRYEATDLR